MKIVSGFDGRDVESFIAEIHTAIGLLEILGQIQATVGDVSMSARAPKTFECRASLENYLRKLKHVKE